MPQELLQFAPSYLAVGIYRLFHDPKIYGAIWKEFSSNNTLKKVIILSTVYFLISFPITKLWVKFFFSGNTSILGKLFARSASSSSSSSSQTLPSGSNFLRFSSRNFITLSLVFGQLNWFIEFFLIRFKLKKIRSKVYHFTIESRDKPKDFWITYVEEWDHPPIEKAQKKIDKMRWYNAVTGPLFRLIILKVMLLPLNFIPFLNTIVGSFLTSLTLSERLLEPYFEVKKMSELQRAIFVVERQDELRWLGFLASILEKFPLLGIIFSISNRIAFAMYAHDLEKRQHLISQGLLPKRHLPYISKTVPLEPDVPLNAIGNFPAKKT